MQTMTILVSSALPKKLYRKLFIEEVRISTFVSRFLLFVVFDSAAGELGSYSREFGRSFHTNEENHAQ